MYLPPVFPLTFHLLRKCRKWCKRSELNVKMPELLRRSLLKFWVSPRKKKKEKKIGHWSERSANVLVFYWLPAVNKGVVLQTAAAYGF